MSKLLFELLFCAVGLLCCWHFTRAAEMRSTRWIKLVVSAPLFFLISRPFARTLEPGGAVLSVGDIHVFFLMLLLAIIWAPNVSWSVGTAVSDFFYGGSGAPEGMPADYGFVKSHLRDRNFEEALKLTLLQLQKHPKDYEGLMIAASIYQQMKLPADAMIRLKTVVENADATDAQKDAARGEYAVCEEICEQLQRQVEVRRMNES